MQLWKGCAYPLPINDEMNDILAFIEKTEDKEISTLFSISDFKFYIIERYHISTDAAIWKIKEL